MSRPLADAHVERHRQEALRLWHQWRRGMTSREYYEHVLHTQGRRWPTEAETRAHPLYVDLMAVGQNWVACTDRLPHEDTGGIFYYLVVSPYCDGWLECCRHFHGRWAYDDGGYNGQVAYWKLAAEGERRSREATAEEWGALAIFTGEVSENDDLVSGGNR